MRRTALATGVLLLLLAAGGIWRRSSGPEPAPCSREQRPGVSERLEPSATPPASPSTPAVVTLSGPPPPPEPKGSILGRVTISGDPPRRRPIRLPDGKESLSEDAVVDREGRLKGAFVYVKRGLDSRRWVPSKIPVSLDVVGYRFDPHVLGVQSGQELRITGFDPQVHWISSVSYSNPTVTTVPPWRGSFRQPEIMMKIACDFHPWECAWVGVLDHPFFAVSSEEGLYGLAGLPAGRYTVATWHERFASVERRVDVPADGSVALDFLLDARK